jgi:hypothetical protein
LCRRANNLRPALVGPQVVGDKKNRNRSHWQGLLHLEVSILAGYLFLPAVTAAYKELEEDPHVGALEIAALAKRLTGSAIKARAAAMKKIWARHHSLMVFKAKSEPRDGRLAA